MPGPDAKSPNEGPPEIIFAGARFFYNPDALPVIQPTVSDPWA